MGIRVEWDNDEQTVVRWEFTGRWTWDEYYEAQAKHMALLDSVPHIVHTIADLHQSALIPSGAISQFRSAIRPHPHSGLTVLVGMNRFVEIMLELYAKFQREQARRIVTASSVQEARQLLAKHMQGASPAE